MNTIVKLLLAYSNQRRYNIYIKLVSKATIISTTLLNKYKNEL